MAEKLSARVERLENLMGVLADKQSKLDDVLVLLTEAQIRTEERFQKTDERFQKTDERIAEIRADMRESSRAVDERIDKLVSAIGEMMRRNGGN